MRFSTALVVSLALLASAGCSTIDEPTADDVANQAATADVLVQTLQDHPELSAVLLPRIHACLASIANRVGVPLPHSGAVPVTISPTSTQVSK